MTYEQAHQMLKDNEHIKGQKINNKKISLLMIVTIPFDGETFGKALAQARALGYSLPNPNAQDYEVYAIFDLQRSLSIPPETLSFDTLSSVLNKLKT